MHVHFTARYTIQNVDGKREREKEKDREREKEREREREREREGWKERTFKESIHLHYL